MGLSTDDSQESNNNGFKAKHELKSDQPYKPPFLQSDLFSSANHDTQETQGLSSYSDMQAFNQQETTTPKADRSLTPALSDDQSQGSYESGSSKETPCAEGAVKQDRTYREKRKKNNESAKRSRDAKRMKDEQVALQVILLQEENDRLHAEKAELEREVAEYRYALSNL